MITTEDSARGRLSRKWYWMRPPSHMPLPAMMIAPSRTRDSAADSSGLSVNRISGEPRAPIADSKVGPTSGSSVRQCLRVTAVALVASGEST